MSRPLFSWRHAVLRSAALSATSKHVMLTLSCHMNDVGGGCYPSIDTLAAETSLTCRTVSGALNAAEAAGFVARNKHGFGGQNWRRNEYRAVFPDDSGLHYGLIPWTKSASDRSRTQAQRRVKSALQSGELVREACVLCGEPKTVAHHHDYTLPLDVWWLCHEHHRCLHAAEKNGAKVAKEDQHLATEGDEPPSTKVTKEFPHLSGEGDESLAKGDEPPSTKVAKEVRTNSSVNSTNNSTGGRATQTPDDVYVNLALKGDQTHAVTVEDMTELARRFPGVDVPTELQRMESWCQRNLEKRKPRDKIQRFIDNWMQRRQPNAEKQQGEQNQFSRSDQPQRVDHHFAAMRQVFTNGGRQ